MIQLLARWPSQAINNLGTSAMELIKNRKWKIISVPLLMLLPLSILVFIYDRESFEFVIFITILMSGYIIYNVIFRKIEARGVYIDFKGIRDKNNHMYEWDNIEVVEIKNDWLFGKELTIVNVLNQDFEKFAIGLGIIEKKSFLRQLRTYAPADNILRLMVEDYFKK